MQRYVERFPAAGEVIIFDRSWYNRVSVEHLMGFTSDAEYKRFLELCLQIEQYIGRRHHPDQDLARGRTGRAGTAVSRPHQRSPAPMETKSDGYRDVQKVVRLLAGARSHAQGDGQEARALVCVLTTSAAAA